MAIRRGVGVTRAILAASLAMGLAATPGGARAGLVTKVAAPLAMTRPIDSVLYGFPVEVDYTAGANEGGTKILIVFREVAGGNIDGINLAIPMGTKAGDKLAATFALFVGCRPITGGDEVFGPLGGTGAANITAEYAISTNQIFGNATVTCTDPLIMPDPTNGPKSNVPEKGSGSPPSVPDPDALPTVTLTAVPEPPAVGLVATGAVFLAGSHLRRSRRRANA